MAGFSYSNWLISSYKYFSLFYVWLDDSRLNVNLKHCCGNIFKLPSPTAKEENEDESIILSRDINKIKYIPPPKPPNMMLNVGIRFKYQLKG